MERGVKGRRSRVSNVFWVRLVTRVSCPYGLTLSIGGVRAYVMDVLAHFNKWEEF